MAIQLSDKYLADFVNPDDLAYMKSEAKNAYEKIKNRSGAGNDFLGWVDLPVAYDRNEFTRIEKAASYIQHNCDIFIVIGIGGSYLGARAAIEFCTSAMYNSLKKETPEIYFVGNSLSSSHLNEILSLCDGKDICINVISKSGTTTEPAIAFRIFRELIEKKYSENEAKKRIFVTTDKSRGKLKELSDKKGYETFVVPDDVGGRYSVLTAVGLLPIAVSGTDIHAMIEGAEKARKDCYLSFDPDNDCAKYAMIRNYLYRNGKAIEIMAAYEPSLSMTGEWWKQLYGESEGKDGKGLFPVSVIFSTDLHSLGQIIQQGVRNIFETVMVIGEDRSPLVIPSDKANGDGMNFIAGKTLDFVNKNAFTATCLSHADGGVPNVVLTLDRRDAENFGYMVYFFEFACGLSGYILNVNPFDQPGVEGYKKNMFALLGKPGAENDARREELLKRIRQL